MRRIFLGILLTVAASANAAELPPEIARVLAGHGISTDDASIVVRRLADGEPLLEHLPDVARNPASVMKLVTTWSALEILGPAYSWNTDVYLLGDFDGRKLDGDLGLKGYGDPFLVIEQFWKMLRELRHTGLEDIDGDLVLDASYFRVDEDDPGSFDGQPYRTYNVVPSALLVNFKSVYFRFTPDVSNGRVTVIADPALSNLEIDNELRLAQGPCGGYQRGISFNPGDAIALDKIVFDGQFPARCRVYGMSRAVLQHDTYTLGLFETLWAELGGRFDGAVRSAAIAEDQRPVLVWRSPPLADVIRSINKNSNNVMTRQLLYTLAATQLGPPGTRQNGVVVIGDFLRAKGLNPDSLVLRNGAGLSRDARISAGLMADVLSAASRSPYVSEFVSSLSIGGLDGTTRGRYDRASGNGRMHLKSGRLDHVSALAGYLHAPSGDCVIVMMLNTEDAHRGPGQEFEAAVLRWVSAQLAAPAASTAVP